MLNPEDSLDEILLDLVERLQADNSLRVDLSDIIQDLKLRIKIQNIGDQE